MNLTMFLLREYYERTYIQYITGMGVSTSKLDSLIFLCTQPTHMFLPSESLRSIGILLVFGWFLLAFGEFLVRTAFLWLFCGLMLARSLCTFYLFVLHRGRL
jgi:hypothetical protein